MDFVRRWSDKTEIGAVSPTGVWRVLTPKNMPAGRHQEIHAERDRKLEDARKQRQVRRQQAA